jgi:hypothetical protein
MIGRRAPVPASTTASPRKPGRIDGPLARWGTQVAAGWRNPMGGQMAKPRVAIPC